MSVALILIFSCVLQPGDYPYNCGAGPSPFYNRTYHVDVHDNRFYYPNASNEPEWKAACGCWPGPKTGAPSCPFKTFADWQRYGHDKGSIISLQRSNQAIVAQARGLLLMPPAVAPVVVALRAADPAAPVTG